MITLATDTALRPNQTGWGIGTDGQQWIGGMTGLSVSNNELIATGTATTSYYLRYGANSIFNGLPPRANNFDLSMRFKISAASDQAGCLFDWFDGNNFCQLFFLQNEVILTKYITGTATNLYTSTSITLTPGVFYWCHLNVNGNVASFRFWQDGNLEPSTWLTTITDPIFLCGGQYGLYGYTSSSSDTIYFDHFLVTSSSTITNLAVETAVRANATAWGTGTDGQIWQAGAGSVTGTSVSSNELIATGQATTHYYMTYGGNTNGGKVQVYNFDMYVRLQASAAADQAGLLFDFSNGNNFCAAFLLSNEVICQKVVSGTTTNLFVSTSVTFTPGTFYQCHLNVNGNVASFRFWQDGTVEPSTWTFQVTDNIFLGGGQYGLYGYTSASGDTISFDHFTVSSTGLIPNYYIDPVNGSDSNNGQSQISAFQTLTHASQVVNPGCTVWLVNGTYNAASGHTTTGSGTPYARIAYQALNTGQALIRANDGISHIWTQDGQYVDVIGMDISSTTNNVDVGIIYYSSYCSVKQCMIHDIPHSSGSGTGGAGIDFESSASYCYATGNLVYNIGNYSPNILCQGIYCSGPYPIVWTNLFFNCAGWGIHCYHQCTNGSIYNNLTAQNGNGGIMNATDGTTTNDFTIIANNISYNNTGYGIREYEDPGSGVVGSHCQYLNNCFYLNTLGDHPSSGTAWFSGSLYQSNIDADPQFVFYQNNGAGNYHLLFSSPCIDAGTAIGAPPTDYEGNPLSQGAGVDIGPYEYVVSVSTPLQMPIIDTDSFRGRIVGSGLGTASGGSIWRQLGGSVIPRVAGGEGLIAGPTNGSESIWQLGQMVAADAEMSMRFTLGNTSDSLSLLLRVQDLNNHYLLRAQSTGLSLYKRIAGSLTSLQTASVSTTGIVGSFYWLKLRTVGQALLGKLWADGTIESAFQVVATDSTFAIGGFGLSVVPQSSSPILFDSLKIASTFQTTVFHQGGMAVGIPAGVQPGRQQVTFSVPDGTVLSTVRITEG